MNIEFKKQTEDKAEKAIVIGLNCGQGAKDLEEAEQSLLELAELVATAGALVVGSVLQNRDNPEPAWFIGKGKLDEIAASAAELAADTLVFDDELSGSQIRNIENATGLKVLDRTFVILDIFAGRAQTREGKLQVELAQLQYRLSRLIGTGQALSRLGGGIGTRGPGETQLETDRRHISRRIAYLKRTLKEIGQRRERTRTQRKNNEAVVAAVVGYTNAGKSTFVNLLCQSDLYAMDQVFATLDPIARRLILPDGQHIILVDTVGFIRKLPHHLIDAFKATLEEVSQADIIIQVTDAADNQAPRQIEIVYELLEQLDAINKPRLHILNKADLVSGLPDRSLTGIRSDGGTITITASARTGQGLDQILSAIQTLAGHDLIPAKILLPYNEADKMNYIKQYGIIDSFEYLPEGIEINARIKSAHYTSLRPWIHGSDINN